MPQRILVVEDEPGIADNITYALRTEGFDVVWCATGRDAKKALDEGDIALMILDVGLPDRNGFELCKEIRKTSELPIIFLTARADEVDRIVGLEIGGDDYVVKPFSPRELSARVKAILRRTAEKEPPGTRAEAVALPFAVDAKRLSISYCGRPLDLSRYEFRILELLVNRPGWVFSREQILDRVWEEPESSMDRTVDTHIKTIRAKLRQIKPEPDPIRTHRGLGYSLRESW
ncbi:MAG: two-component system response regulator CreB [Kiritimatiellae bacterium]|nr:two-component system response regulator CreB [Kiritimatiellia bacterium]